MNEKNKKKEKEIPNYNFLQRLKLLLGWKLKVFSWIIAAIAIIISIITFFIALFKIGSKLFAAILASGVITFISKYYYIHEGWSVSIVLGIIAFIMMNVVYAIFFSSETIEEFKEDKSDMYIMEGVTLFICLYIMIAINAIIQQTIIGWDIDLPQGYGITSAIMTAILIAGVIIYKN